MPSLENQRAGEFNPDVQAFKTQYPILGLYFFSDVFIEKLKKLDSIEDRLNTKQDLPPPQAGPSRNIGKSQGSCFEAARQTRFAP